MCLKVWQIIMFGLYQLQQNYLISVSSDGANNQNQEEGSSKNKK